MRNTKRIFSMLILGLVFLSFMVAVVPSLSAGTNEETKTEETKTEETEKSSSAGLIAWAAAFAMAITASIGAMSQSRLASTALEGMARNPGAANKMFVPMILALAFIESLVLYALLIAFFLQGKV